MKLSEMSAVLLLPLCAAGAAGSDEPWIPLFDGRSLSGWRAVEPAGCFSVRDGAIVCTGPRSHLFYAGDVAGASFKNFELEAEVLARPGANSGIFFHTEIPATRGPLKGYEAQICNTYVPAGGRRELRKTGSLYGVRNIYGQFFRDDEWLNFRIRVEGKRIRILVDKRLLVDYTEPRSPARSPERRGRVLSRGTFALQCHDPASEVRFRSVKVRVLPDDLPESFAPDDPLERTITELHAKGFPLVDFHVHLKGGLTLDEALAKSRAAGINYGIAANCGIGFPVTDDASLIRYLDSLAGQPIFKGMQAEGREWVNLFSAEAVARFDYVFTDSMTFTDDVTGKRMRLWMPQEVEVRDAEEFMEMLVRKIEGIFRDEPIDIYVNPTFLPAAIADRYDELWTEKRMDRVITAAARNDIAVEINSLYRLPSIAFIRRAKAAGVKFTFGTNNGGRDLGRLEYSIEAIRECGLTDRDMFLPRAAAEKPVLKKGLKRP